MPALDPFFKSKSIAIVGVSRDTRKVGHVIFRNFIDAGFKGRIFPVNPNAEEILNRKAYRKVSDIKEKIELAIIAVPKEYVIEVLDDCGKKKIRHAIIVTAGFKEEGDIALDKKLEAALKRNNITCLGPNCLGSFDAYTKLDSLFLPRYRLQRPKEGHISFVCQSGAVGSSILDLATEEGYGFSKFASYGNAMNVDESDLLGYLAKDKETKVICLYVEGVKDGHKFMKTVSEVTKKKPIIALKGGRTSEGSKATLSHTGSLAGSADVYSGVFRQTGIIEVNSLEEMFEAARILEKCPKPKGKRVAVITNGGGYGILSADAISHYGLEMAKLSGDSIWQIKKLLKRVTTQNPMDLLGDANTDGYRTALDILAKDNNVDVIVMIVLYQTPLVSTDIVDTITEYNDMGKKPIVVVSAGGEFTEVLKENLESNGVPNFTFPENAVRAIKHLANYYERR